MRFGRLLAAVLLVLASAGVVMVATPSAAQAAGCYGDFCSGKDPSTTGTGGNPCQNGARTVASTEVWLQYVTPGMEMVYEWRKVGFLELRWSDRCQTNWARLTTYQGSYLQWLRIRQEPDGTGYSQEYKTSGYTGNTGVGTFWTNMIYSPVKKTRAYVNCAPGVGSSAILELPGSEDA
jgi:uncharacterized membrane protein